MDFDVTITFPQAGDALRGETLLDSLLAAAPDCDPIVDQDVECDTLIARFSIVSDDAASAGQSTVAILRQLADGAALGSPTSIHVDAASGSALQAA